MPDEPVPSMLAGFVSQAGCGTEVADQVIACWSRLATAQPPIPEPTREAILLIVVRGFMSLDDEPDFLEPA